MLSYRPGKGRTRTVTRVEPVGVRAGGSVTQVGAVPSAVSPVAGSTVTTTGSTVTTTTTTTDPPIIVSRTGTPSTGGIPLPSNAPGGPAVLRPVPTVGPPTSPMLNVAMPPATAGTVPDGATAAQAEAIRSQGVRDFQSATSVLALKANEIDGLWFAFKDLCLGGTTPSGAASTTGREWFVLLGGNGIQAPGDDACRRRLADLTRAGDLFQQQLSVVLDGVRKADLPPGTVREILQRNRLDR